MEDELKKSILKTGTTTIGIVCKEGIVLCADKRATLGEGLFIGHKRVDKILPITDSISVTTAGSVSDIQLLVKLTKAELRLKKLRTRIEPNVKETSSLFGMLVYENIRKFSPILGITAFLIGGVDDKGFWLFEVGPDGSALQHKDFVSTGSGMVVAYGLLEDSYKEDITVEDGVKLAVRALSAAMQRDTPTGSGIDVVVINRDGTKKVVEEEVRQVLIKK
ncbi:MAG: proteasome subunit beta [Candidatus Pacearchaeota archaeon]|nr:MAG: proteasome subunit beta [Candidatus Pacearchaeota archaeon]